MITGFAIYRLLDIISIAFCVYIITCVIRYFFMPVGYNRSFLKFWYILSTEVMLHGFLLLLIITYYYLLNDSLPEFFTDAHKFITFLHEHERYEKIYPTILFCVTFNFFTWTNNLWRCFSISILIVIIFLLTLWH